MGDLADFCPFLRFLAIFGPPYLLELDFDRLDFLHTDKRLLELQENLKTPSFRRNGGKLRRKKLKKRPKTPFTPTLTLRVWRTVAIGA